MFILYICLILTIRETTRILESTQTMKNFTETKKKLHFQPLAIKEQGILMLQASKKKYKHFVQTTISFSKINFYTNNLYL